jgi:NO-binding membrane sensor protein with MHYT domain
MGGALRDTHQLHFMGMMAFAEVLYPSYELASALLSVCSASLHASRPSLILLRPRDPAR